MDYFIFDAPMFKYFMCRVYRHFIVDFCLLSDSLWLYFRKELLLLIVVF